MTGVEKWGLPIVFRRWAEASGVWAVVGTGLFFCPGRQGGGLWRGGGRGGGGAGGGGGGGWAVGWVGERGGGGGASPTGRWPRRRWPGRWEAWFWAIGWTQERDGAPLPSPWRRWRRWFFCAPPCPVIPCWQWWRRRWALWPRVSTRPP